MQVRFGRLRITSAASVVSTAVVAACCQLLVACSPALYPSKHRDNGDLPFAKTSPAPASMGSGPGGPQGVATPLTDPTAAQQHCFAKINEIRAQQGVPALSLDAGLSAFALAGSQALASGGAPHAHFIAAGGDAMAASGFCGGGGETQAPGWSAADPNATIDQVLASMMAEGPGGGHHDAIVSPAFTRVGVGIVVTAQGLYFTNDFSPSCR